VRRVGVAVLIGTAVFATWYAARQVDGFGAGLKRVAATPYVLGGALAGTLLYVAAR
jgi:hypothetical protein